MEILLLIVVQNIDIKKGLHKALSKEFQDFVSEKAENPYASSKDSVSLITEKLIFVE